jgi:hypothetical protein
MSPISNTKDWPNVPFPAMDYLSHDNGLNYDFFIKVDVDAQRLCKIVFPGENTSTNTYPWELKLPRCFFRQGNRILSTSPTKRKQELNSLRI